MAFLYTRKRSPFFWIRYRKSSGKRPRSTRLRCDDPAQARQAQEELRAAIAEEKFVKAERQMFKIWVPPFIRDRHRNHKANYESYANYWKALSAYLATCRVLYPNDLTPECAHGYIEWRTRRKKREHGVRRACRNTAIKELGFLRLLLRHAVSIGYATRNPLDALRFRRDDTREKPEITQEHFQIIWRELPKLPEWQQTQFLIAWYTGCRINETNVPLNCVDLERMEIHFPTPKMGKPFTVPCPAELVPLFRKLKADGRRKTAFTTECDRNHQSKMWARFFRSLGMPYTFHSTRVSYICACIRSGLPENVSCRLVNHATLLVHRLYQRWRASDLREAVDKIRRPLPSLIQGPGSPQGAPSVSSPGPTASQSSGSQPQSSPH